MYSTFMFESLVPCRSYTIELQGFTKNESWINVVTQKKEVLPDLLPALPEPVMRTITNVSAELMYKPILNKPNDCMMTKFLVQCQSSNNLTKTYFPYEIDTVFIKITIDELIPNTKYKCVAFVINRAGITKGSEIQFITLEGIPGEPRNVTVEVMSSTAVRVMWEPPTLTYGILTNYAVVVEHQSLLHAQAPGCLPSALQPRHVSVDGGTTVLILDELLANMQFQVRVKATTKAGYGPLSLPINSTTPIGDSDRVRNLEVNVTLNITGISWKPPCNTSGPLTGFLISLNGSRLYHRAANYTWIMALTESLKENYSVTYSTTNLTPDAVYILTITPIGYNQSKGQNEFKQFSVPPRIPATPSPLVPLPEVKAASSTAMITFQSNLFPDTEGTIKYYSILVAECFPNPPAYGWLINNTWPNMSNWAEAVSQKPIPPYQATPMYWEPFIDMPHYPFAVRQFELGDETCSDKDQSYCNGPLKPGIVYNMRIRAFTSTGYRDSSTISFTTNSLSYMGGNAAILTLFIMTVLLICVLSYVLTSVSCKRLKEENINLSQKEAKLQYEENTSSARNGLLLAAFLMHTDTILTSEQCLAEEYKNLEVLSQKNISTTIIAGLPQNKIKNRYTDIAPYDWNRVVLEGDENNDYINASHIKFEEESSIQYIACQGPPNSQCGSFWRMIIQCQVNVIVMLCQPIEKNKEKCSIYYPKLRETLEFGDITVYCKNEEEFTYYILRSLEAKKGDQITEVKQFHFLMWPDRKVPDSPFMMVEFIKAVNKEVNQLRSMICVHCSAGVGRTGTFITINALTRILKKNRKCKINVFDAVLKLRDQRCKMVQTQIQYEYIYKCLKYTIEEENLCKSKGKTDVPPLNKELLQMKELALHPSS